MACQYVERRSFRIVLCAAFLFPSHSHSLEFLVPVASHDALPDCVDVVFDLLHSLAVLVNLVPLAVVLVHESVASTPAYVFSSAGRVHFKVDQMRPIENSQARLQTKANPVEGKHHHRQQQRHQQQLNQMTTNN